MSDFNIRFWSTSIALTFIGLFSNLHFAQAQTATLDKAVDLTEAASGETLKYTLTYGCSSLDADCEGAILVDELPPEVEFLSATQALVSGNSGTSVISPVYDPVTHTVTWDFTAIMPEMGLPDGSSGIVEILVEIPPGVTPNGIMLTNNANLPTDNAGTPNDNVTTTTEGIMPMWSIAKSVTSGPIYHDTPVEYEIEVCSDSPMGNLHLLPGAMITDNLPDGAVFQSASGNGVHDGGMPGSIAWTIPDTFKVDAPCQIFTVIVEYPVADMVNNNTGLTNEISKTNEALLDATAIGDIPVMDVATVNNPLLPPFFQAGIRKETGNGNGATPDVATNKFIIGVSNESTTAINDFIVTDAIPPQANITSIHIEPSMGDTVFADIRVQLNNSGTWIVFQTSVSTASESEFDVTTIPGWMPGTSYVSDVEVNFGTVDAGFNGNVELIFEPAYPTANDGSMTDLDTEYTNTAEVTYTRPLDGMMFTEMASTPFCVVDGLSARIDPDKDVEINYVTTPDGDPTTGNPYFKGARVKYTLHLENDGSDASGDDPEITADSSFTIISDPIGADLLPAQMLYETGSWTIVNNTSDEPWGNSGTNPSFELIDDFNGTGKTLLRWTFTGELEPGEELDICFNAFIQDTVETGRIVENSFAMTSATDIYCDEGVCEPAGTNPELNNYFGQSSDPSVLIPGISEMCLQTIELEVADSTSMPDPFKTVLSAGPYAPTESAPAELGLAEDVVQYGIGFCNNQMANFTLPDPVLVDLLPEELTYVPGSITLLNNTTGLPFDSNLDGTTNPTFEVIDDFNGTGRQLLRWVFTGEIPINACAEYTFETLINLGAGGMIQNEPYIKAGFRQYECVNGEVADDLDYDGNGETDADGDALCEAANTADILIPQIISMGANKLVRGTLDAEFQESSGGMLGIGNTQPNDSVFYQINVFNPGNETLTDGVIVDIFPHIGDVGVQLNTTDRDTEWVPYLIAPITPPSPTIDVFYSQSTNPCRPEIEPVDASGCVDDWSLTPPADLSTVRAVMFDFANEDIEPAEEFVFDILMFSPDSVLMSPGIAWNSLARNANEVPAQEPNKVGIQISGYDLALRKTLKSGQNQYVSPGDDVDFTITVINQGTESVQNIVVTDYIPALFTLNDNDWMASGNNATYNLTNILAPDDSISIDITLTVVATAQTGDLLDNFAEISDFEDLLGNHPNDWDSTPDTDDVNDAGGTIDSDADDATFGNGTGATPDTDATTDEDDHDGARIIICPAFENTADDQETCTNNLAALTDIVVPTSAETTQDVKFTYYTSAQSGSNMYNGAGTDLLTVNPVGGNVTLPEANIPIALGTYYIYSVLEPAPADPNCRPFDLVIVTINPPIAANPIMDTEICLNDDTMLTASATGGNGNYAYNWSNGGTTATITVSPATTTTYTVTITDDSNNCEDMTSVTVTVNPLPTLTISNDTTICNGDSRTLVTSAADGTPGYVFSWDNGLADGDMHTVSPMTTTTYNVTVTDTKMCTATDNSTVTVPTPFANAGEDVTICESDQTTLTASGGVSYLWNTMETTASITVSPTTTTTYMVTVTNSIGCTEVDMVDVIIGDCDFPDYNNAGALPTCSEQPCHAISSDLYFGFGVTAEPSTSGDANADSDMDDGINFPTNLFPNANIILPVTIFNNSGSDAFLTAWIDWNGDGDFDDTGEQIANESFNNAMFNGTFTTNLLFTVPSDVNQTTPIASRFRVSTDMSTISSPCRNVSCAPNGEVEDYLIQLGCPPPFCAPVEVTIIRD
jgi:uncharacterized repeat protein (TIGR01451 family)